ncbi:NAD(P)H-binding protein [Pseudarthrobacter raffinosi]|uniref:NAD(P)H-binding protein n=1 Tax=Pseudarthrobacter raffinosi TaxID=2953651 RepID=UPI00208EA7ED|nr:NAD(P)H-binding protein [Pseudarthrobacter sp. MDT3-28]MCO4239717.1 NAD(P)H-binding protein [Pseudarthrobacter sp. MDT3-28]
MILVTGASGHLATAVLEHLAESGAPAVGGTRNPAGNPELRQLDFDDAGTLNMEGVETLVLISAGTAEDDVVIDRHTNAIAAAERGGVQHIVYTSLAGEGDHLGFALAHRWTERRLRNGNVAWTVLRNGLYAELIGQLLTPREGVITAPFGRGGVAAVARQDLAEAASIVAQNPRLHSGRTYNLVGNRAITAQDVADELGVTYRPGTMEDLRQSLDAAALLPFQPSMLLSIHSAAAHGFLEGTATDVARLLGREPRDPLTVAAAAAHN